MPELPEVEVIARRLRSGNKKEPRVVGRTVTAVHVPSSKVVKHPSRAHFIERVTGARVVDVERRAKHLLIGTDRGTLLVHLRLTGDLHVVTQGAALKFPRFVLDLDDGRALAFTDGRHLGEVRLVDDVDAHLPELGPEPLGDAFTVDALAKVLHGKRAVKAVLLDQSAVAGVGNIYADEACFRAKLHPATRADALDRAAVKTLHGAIRAALTKSIDDLVKDDGEIAWRYENRAGESPFLVYDRAGEPCKRCKTKLKSARVSGRATVFCPRCQKKRTR